MADKLRVALMTREYPPNVYGGAGVHVEYLARELAKHIHVDVHCWGNPTDQPASTDPNANPQVHSHQPAAEILTAPDSKFKAALEALSINLAEVADLHTASLIHTHTWYASLAGFLARMLYRIPFVLTTHSLEPLRAWKAEQLGTGYALSSWAESTAIHAADAIIAVSHGTRADILRAYPGIDPARIHVIYNGIDLHQYRRTADTTALRTYGIDPTRPYVLFVGRITRQKGVTHLVDAIQHLPPDTQVVLCAGAPDTPEIATEMRAKVDEARKHNPNIIWIEKMVTKEETIQLYSHCRVFCCPSVYEPFGIINLEAMACEAPVVASATGGILEVVIDPTHPQPTSDGSAGHSSSSDGNRVPHVPRTWGHGINESRSDESTNPATQSSSSRPERSELERPLYLAASEPRSGEPAPQAPALLSEAQSAQSKDLHSSPEKSVILSEAQSAQSKDLHSSPEKSVILSGAQSAQSKDLHSPSDKSVILSEAQSAQSKDLHSPSDKSVILSGAQSAQSKDLHLGPATEPQTGFLVPYDQDPKTGFPTNPAQFAKDLAAKLNALLNDEQKARQLGQNGRHRAETHFSWQTIAQQTIELYWKLAAPKTPNY